MGKASRRKKVINPANRPAYRAPIPFVDRPFEGLSAEKELVAMREIIPCATMTARTNADNGGVEFDLVTLVPDGNPAMVRGDGRILVGLQTRSNSGDLSHDVAAAILAAIELKNNGEEGVVEIDVREPSPRLQDILDLDSFGSMELRENFAFWLNPDEELTHEMRHALEQNTEEVIPTEAVPGVDGMFWCAMNANFVRYVTDVDENQLFKALARLKVADAANLGEGAASLAPSAPAASPSPSLNCPRAPPQPTSPTPLRLLRRAWRRPWPSPIPSRMTSAAPTRASCPVR